MSVSREEFEQLRSVLISTLDSLRRINDEIRALVEQFSQDQQLQWHQRVAELKENREESK
jgi:BMFP domain-containing protein YqiC